MTDADLIRALRDCYDPVTKRNVVDAAMVRSATLVRDTEAPGADIAGVPAKYVARIRVLSPTGDEALNAQLAAQIENRLAGLETISRAEVELLPPLFPMLR